MASLLEELKRRNVIRVAVGYLVLAWVVLQITDLVAPALRRPEWTLSFVTFIGIIGFPFALFFAWVFELTPEGIKRSEDVEPEDSITPQTAGNLNRIIIGLLCVAVVTLLVDRYFGLSQRLGSDAEEGASVATAVETETVTETVQENSGPRSIAVLPFVNMSNDAEQEYFSDGISEELLNALAQIRELRVAARTSSFAFKGQNQDITRIGEQLKVETVLEGSVRRSGKRVRITAQLINVEDGYHLWSNTYDRDLTDIFAVQDEISAAIVEALRVHLTEGELPSAAKTVDIAAYNLYLQARHNVRSRTRESLELAVKQYQQALDIDPGYAPAWAGKALATQLLDETNYGDTPLPEAARLAQAYLEKAFAIDADLGEAHAAQALTFMAQGQYREAQVSIERALESLPNEGILYAWKSQCLAEQGQYGDASDALEKAFEVDPLHHAVRRNWMNTRAGLGDADAVRAVTTPGTPDYYYAEWAIAWSEGRWSDMYLLLDEAEKVPGASSWVDYNKGVTLWFMLGELARGQAGLPSVFGQLYLAISTPAAALVQLGPVEPSALTVEQRAIMLLAMARSGQCAGAGDVVGHLELETRDDFGDITDWTSLFDLAAWYAWCLRENGETDRAKAVAKKAMAYTERVAHESLLLRDYGDSYSLLQVVSGDPDGAADTVRTMLQHDWLYPIYLVVYPHYAELAKREDFQQLLAGLQQKLDKERQKLGWPPRALEDI